MSKQRRSNSAFGGKALEMIMRDVLDGMADLAIMQSWESDWGEFEVLGTEPVGCPDTSTQDAADTAAAGKRRSEPNAAATVVELKQRRHQHTRATTLVGKKIAGPRA